MSDTRELLRPGVEGFEPKPDAFERVLARRDRKRRRQRIAAGFVGAAVFALVALWFVRLLSSVPTPAVPRPEPAPPRNGAWVVISVSSLDPGARPMSRGKPANLFVTGPDGSARLLAGAEGDTTLQHCPAFSPDGTMLAYAETGPGEKSLIVRGFSAAGTFEGAARRIRMPAAKSFVAPCPVWAPDGQRLAAIAPGRGVMIVDPDGTTHLVDVNASGLSEGGRVQLTWSPDGSQLALLVPYAYPREEVWLVPADGGAAHLLPGFDREADTTGIAWTADGRSVVAAGSGCCPERPPFVDVVDVTTGRTHEVPLPQTWHQLNYEGIIGSEGDRFLLWRGWDLGVAWVDLQGNVTPVKLRYPMTTAPTLSPDGRQLLYVTSDPAFGGLADAHRGPAPRWSGDEVLALDRGLRRQLRDVHLAAEIRGGSRMKTNPDRRTGSWLVVAASLLLAAACSGASTTGSASSPTVAPSSTTDAGLIQANFQGAGTHPTVTLEAPAPPWTLYRDDSGRGFALTNEAGGAWRSISFWDVGMVPRNPCHPIGNVVDPGPTVDGLVTALEDQSMRHATAPTDVTLAGYQGKYLEWSVPADMKVTGDSDFSGCDVQSDGHRNFESWEGNGGRGTALAADGRPGRSAVDPERQRAAAGRGRIALTERDADADRRGGAGRELDPVLHLTPQSAHPSRISGLGPVGLRRLTTR